MPPSPQRRKEFTVQDAFLIYRNFEGRKTMFNSDGKRKATIVLPADVAERMLADGWNVRFKEPKEEGDEGFWTIEFEAKYQFQPPKIFLIADDKRIPLDEDTVEVLDFAELETVDLICNGYDWEVNGKTGTKAYLKTMYATIHLNDLEKKYGYELARGGGEIQDEEGDLANE